MFAKQKLSYRLVSIFLLVSILLSGFQPGSASAQVGDGLKRQVNPQTGKVSLIAPESGRSLSALRALGTFIRPEDPARALLQRYAPEFGIQDPGRDLREFRRNELADGRMTVKYQQTYAGIPVIGGELIVNTNANGDLYSLSGEVALKIALPTQPEVTAAQAAETARGALAKWYQVAADEFVVSEPELWVFDERLLQPSTRPAELVWRMEVTPKDSGMPVRELVLVNAQRGHITFHFNQVDAAWLNQNSITGYKEKINQSQNILITIWPVYFEMALDETRGWLYGSDSTGNKIDVISTTTLQLVKSITLAAGATPKGIALSPDGNELAIAQSGAGSIIFVNPNTGNTIATVIPDVTVGPNKPWDVIYGRPGRLYSTGNPDSGGFEYIHIIDTTTHLEISKSSHIVRSAPRLSISADKNTLYANDANFSPQKLYKYDISTDTIPSPISTPHTTGFSATMHIVDPVTGYIFTNAGQVWTPDLQVQVGSTGLNGEIASIPNRNAIAIASSGNYDIVFVSSDTLYTLSTYTLPPGSAKGALVAQSDGNKLFVSTVLGVVAVDLTSFPPGIPGTLPTGSLPYADVVLDESHGVLYGSNTTGHKIDVVSLSTLQMVDEIRLINGSSPKGMDLSPDGSELAVALSGADQIAFINTNTLTISASVFPESSDTPFDVIYGRPGRLYSSGSPYSSGFEYIHVIDTTTHTNVSKSSFIIRAGPSLAMSADNNYLFANEQFSPNDLYKINVSTDTISNLTSIPSGFSANTYIVSDDESKVFTSTGQVWSNPLDLNSSTQLGLFNAQGNLVEIPGLNFVASLGSSGSIKFVKTTDYSIVSTITIPSVSTFGPSLINSNESTLFANTNNGIVALNLDPDLPASISINSGSNQSAPLQTQFPQPLKVKVTNFLGQAMAGLTVTFTAPANGASGSFANTGTNITTAVTDINGIATSSVFTANNANGGYLVNVTVDGLASSVDFQLTNGALVSTYTANNTASLPGSFVCNQSQPTCPAGDAHAKAAHKYAIGTYNLYASQHGRDSIDNAGMTIVSTVRYCHPSFACPYANAFWNGVQMAYGSAYGFPLADDVVAHELTHGVTQYESNLFYYYQSGAINESFSDVWGEYYDQSNGQGNDTAGVKWLMGEDVSGAGAIRNMSHPPAFSDPDMMSSPYYYEGPEDNGGVHYNSGVNNKAVFLMVDGGTFNGRTVTPLGWTKTIQIYYEVQTNRLTSGADYSDLYYALQSACSSLIGQHGITSANCVEVKDALDAVEMNGQPAPNFNTDAPLCTTAGTFPQYTFQDDLESGLGNWTFTNSSPYPRWQLDTIFGPYAQSGSHSLYADDYPAYITDASARLTSFVVPANAYLHFAQAYEFENVFFQGVNYYFDGGVLEYSTNGGASWADANWLITHNGYTGTIYNDWNNPLKGRTGFVGSSHGYISTRLNLSALAGQTVTFRWRMGLDDSSFAWGWWVDNVKVYTCKPPYTISGDVGVAGVTLSYFDGMNKTVTSSGNGSYTLTVPPQWSGTITPSHACYTFDPLSRSYNNVTANQLAQDYVATLDVEVGCSTIDVNIGATHMGNYGVPPGGEQRLSYAASGGPVKVESTNGVDLVAAIRLQALSGGILLDYNESIGTPASALSHKYYFPVYENLWAPLNSQIRFAHLNPSATQIKVTIGTEVVFNESVPANTEKRLSFARSGGPVVIESVDGVTKVLAAIRLQCMSAGTLHCYSETPGIPVEALSAKYYFPVYENLWAPLNSQLRFAHLSTETKQIKVTIGGEVLFDEEVPANTEKRLTFAKSGGPVIVESVDGVTQVIAAIRLQAMSGGVLRDYNESMGIPASSLSHKYYFPVYENLWAPLNSQIRFAHLSTETKQIRVTIGSEVVFDENVPANTEKRLSFPKSGGPVIIESVDGVTQVIAAIRLQCMNSGILNCYSETPGLPVEALDTLYYFPVYENLWVHLNSQLRFSVP